MSTNYSNLAGEFSVLSRLALEEIDSALTLGNTKGVDILISNSDGFSRRLEVKTKTVHTKKGHRELAIFGKFLCEWQMGKVHEDQVDENLLYCFVLIDRNKSYETHYFIVPSKVVASYVKEQHEYWEKQPKKLSKRKGKKSNEDGRMFRIGLDEEKSNYIQKKIPIPPLRSEFKDRWDLLKNGSRDPLPTKTVTRRNITDSVKKALQSLIAEDIWLLQTDASERAITHKLAEHLQKIVGIEYNVDCEYNRDGKLPKSKHRLSDAAKQISDGISNTTFEEIVEPQFIFPDIIIHKRDSDEQNLCAIEVKKNTSKIDKNNDIEKLKAYTSKTEYHYQVGLFIKINTGKNQNYQSFEIDVYENGERKIKEKKWDFGST